MTDETETPDLNSQIAELTGEAMTAHRSGDLATRDQLFAERERLAAGLDGGEDGSAPTPEAEPEPEVYEHAEVEEPQPASAEDLQRLVSGLREAGIPEEEIEALDAEWGTDGAANVAYAVRFANHISDAHSELAEVFDREAERNPSLIPVILRLSARLGREMVHGDRAGVELLIGKDSAVIHRTLTWLRGLATNFTCSLPRRGSWLKSSVVFQSHSWTGV